MIYAFFWFLQDALTVLISGDIQIPEIFLLSLVYRLLTKDKDANVSSIWMAFLGGLLWDLRWVGVPGFFTLNYVCVVMGIIWVWNALPVSGRTLFVIFLLFWAAQLLPAILSLFLLRYGSGSARWALFWLQQGCAVPLSFLGAFFYFQDEKAKNL